MDPRVAERGVARRLDAAVAAIRERCAVRPRIAIVLGSGLGAFADEVRAEATIPYGEIQHFPVPRGAGHAGRLVLGELRGVPVAVLAGRAHPYEGYGAEQLVLPLRAARRLGAETVVLTNASGGIRPDLTPGTLMLIADHINLTGLNPLTGPNDAGLGPRFPDMSAAYDPELRAAARRVAGDLGLALPEGVYLGLAGPSFETPAEIRMARALGADAVGMSTVLETIAARHCGLRVLGVSCIANLAAGLGEDTLSARAVYEAAERVRPALTALLTGVVASYDPG